MESSGNNAFYFAQLTDIHVGQSLNPKEAAANLKWALNELISISPKLILATGDLVCAGKRLELQEYSEIAGNYPIPVYALPANHDLWGEVDESAWIDIIGPTRQSIVANDVHFLLWNETQRDAKGGWIAEMRDEQREWLEIEINRAHDKPIIIAQHCPPMPINGSYHDRWNNSNADELLKLLQRHNTLAIVTGHWHRNGEWLANGVRVINTGALCGWQWNGTPPHFCFPVRPGYRLFHYDGQSLRTFWRDGSYWQTQAPETQVSLVSISDANTGGPRPQVRPIDIFAKTRLVVTAYAVETKIANVEWSLTQKDWRPMERTFDGIWSEWQAVIDPLEFRSMGELTCIVRSHSIKGGEAYDSVPVRLAERECAAMVSSVSQSGGERVSELFYMPI